MTEYISYIITYYLVTLQCTKLCPCELPANDAMGRRARQAVGRERYHGRRWPTTSPNPHRDSVGSLDSNPIDLKQENYGRTTVIRGRVGAGCRNLLSITNQSPATEQRVDAPADVLPRLISAFIGEV
ncbi:hypothetical protein EVAR_100568_1 [Eumeta japonica]|uniref:Uncharacterized protein n=1 Tax=Eumeta variegata TaxID=151549 RepID=A0A4C1YCY2_EUMVA|nr:hypothetical protein EVAR_100568_1 [Eumeta japonica]